MGNTYVINGSGYNPSGWSDSGSSNSSSQNSGYNDYVINGVTYTNNPAYAAINQSTADKSNNSSSNSLADKYNGQGDDVVEPPTKEEKGASDKAKEAAEKVVKDDNSSDEVGGKTVINDPMDEVKEKEEATATTPWKNARTTFESFDPDAVNGDQVVNNISNRVDQIDEYDSDLDRMSTEIEIAENDYLTNPTEATLRAYTNAVTEYNNTLEKRNTVFYQYEALINSGGYQALVEQEAQIARYFDRPEEYTVDNVDQYIDRIMYLAYTSDLSEDDLAEISEIYAALSPNGFLSKGYLVTHGQELGEDFNYVSNIINTLGERCNYNMGGFGKVIGNFKSGVYSAMDSMGINGYVRAAGNIAKKYSNSTAINEQWDYALGSQQQYKDEYKIASTIGSIAGGMAMIANVSGIGGAAGNAVGNALGATKLSPFVKGAIQTAVSGGTTLGLSTAASTSGYALSGDISVSDYFKSIAESGLYGAAGGVLTSAAGMGVARSLQAMGFTSNIITNSIVNGAGAALGYGGADAVKELYRNISDETYDTDWAAYWANTAIMAGMSVLTGLKGASEQRWKTKDQITGKANGKAFARKYFKGVNKKDAEAVKTRYRELVKQYHPDRYKGADRERIMKEVNTAHEYIQQTYAEETLTLGQRFVKLWQSWKTGKTSKSDVNKAYKEYQDSIKLLTGTVEEGTSEQVNAIVETAEQITPEFMDTAAAKIATEDIRLGTDSLEPKVDAVANKTGTPAQASATMGATATAVEGGEINGLSTETANAPGRTASGNASAGGMEYPRSGRLYQQQAGGEGTPVRRGIEKDVNKGLAEQGLTYKYVPNWAGDYKDLSIPENEIGTQQHAQTRLVSSTIGEVPEADKEDCDTIHQTIGYVADKKIDAKYGQTDLTTKTGIRNYKHYYTLTNKMFANSGMTRGKANAFYKVYADLTRLEDRLDLSPSEGEKLEWNAEDYTFNTNGYRDKWNAQEAGNLIAKGDYDNILKGFISDNIINDLLSGSAQTEATLLATAQNAYNMTEVEAKDFINSLRVSAQQFLVDEGVLTPEELRAIQEAATIDNQSDYAELGGFKKPKRETPKPSAFTEAMLEKARNSGKEGNIRVVVNPGATNEEIYGADTIVLEQGKFEPEFNDTLIETYEENGNTLYQRGTNDEYIVVSKDGNVVGIFDERIKAVRLASATGPMALTYKIPVINTSSEFMQTGHVYKLDAEKILVDENLNTVNMSELSDTLNIEYGDWSENKISTKVMRVKITDPNVASKLFEEGFDCTNGKHYVPLCLTSSSAKNQEFYFVEDKYFDQLFKKMTAAASLDGQEFNLAKFFVNEGTYLTPSYPIDLKQKDVIVVPDVKQILSAKNRMTVRLDDEKDFERFKAEKIRNEDGSIKTDAEIREFINQNKVGTMVHVVGDVIMNVVDGLFIGKMPDAKSVQFRMECGLGKGLGVNFDVIGFFEEYFPFGTTALYDSPDGKQGGIRYIDRGRGVEMMSTWGEWIPIRGKKGIMFDSALKLSETYTGTADWEARSGDARFRALPRENVYGKSDTGNTMIKDKAMVSIYQFMRGKEVSDPKALSAYLKNNFDTIFNDVMDDPKLAAEMLGSNYEVLKPSEGNQGTIGSTLASLYGEEYIKSPQGRAELKEKLKIVLEDIRGSKIMMDTSDATYQYVAPELVGLFNAMTASCVDQYGKPKKIFSVDGFTGLNAGEIVNERVKSGNALVGRFPANIAEAVKIRKNVKNNAFIELRDKYGLDMDNTYVSIEDTLIKALDNDFDGDTVRVVSGQLADMIYNAEGYDESYLDFGHYATDKLKTNPTLLLYSNIPDELKGEKEAAHTVLIEMVRAMVKANKDYNIGTFDTYLDKLYNAPDKWFQNYIDKHKDELQEKTAKQLKLHMAAVFATGYVQSIDYWKNMPELGEFWTAVDYWKKVMNGILAENGFAPIPNRKGGETQAAIPKVYEYLKLRKRDQFEVENKRNNTFGTNSTIAGYLYGTNSIPSTKSETDEFGFTGSAFDRRFYAERVKRGEISADGRPMTSNIDYGKFANIDVKKYLSTSSEEFRDALSTFYNKISRLGIGASKLDYPAVLKAKEQAMYELREALRMDAVQFSSLMLHVLNQNPVRTNWGFMTSLHEGRGKTNYINSADVIRNNVNLITNREKAAEAINGISNNIEELDSAFGELTDIEKFVSDYAEIGDIPAITNIVGRIKAEIANAKKASNNIAATQTAVKTINDYITTIEDILTSAKANDEIETENIDAAIANFNAVLDSLGASVDNVVAINSALEKDLALWREYAGHIDAKYAASDFNIDHDTGLENISEIEIVSAMREIIAKAEDTLGLKRTETEFKGFEEIPNDEPVAQPQSAPSANPAADTIRQSTTHEAPKQEPPKTETTSNPEPDKTVHYEQAGRTIPPSTYGKRGSFITKKANNMRGYRPHTFGSKHYLETEVHDENAKRAIQASYNAWDKLTSTLFDAHMEPDKFESAASQYLRFKDDPTKKFMHDDITQQYLDNAAQYWKNHRGKTMSDKQWDTFGGLVENAYDAITKKAEQLDARLGKLHQIGVQAEEHIGDNVKSHSALHWKKYDAFNIMRSLANFDPNSEVAKFAESFDYGYMPVQELAGSLSQQLSPIKDMDGFKELAKGRKITVSGFDGLTTSEIPEMDAITLCLMGEEMASYDKEYQREVEIELTSLGKESAIGKADLVELGKALEGQLSQAGKALLEVGRTAPKEVLLKCADVYEKEYGVPLFVDESSTRATIRRRNMFSDPSEYNDLRYFLRPRSVKSADETEVPSKIHVENIINYLNSYIRTGARYLNLSNIATFEQMTHDTAFATSIYDLAEKYLGSEAKEELKYWFEDFAKAHHKEQKDSVDKFLDYVSGNLTASQLWWRLSPILSQGASSFLSYPEVSTEALMSGAFSQATFGANMPKEVKAQLKENPVLANRKGNKVAVTADFGNSASIFNNKVAKALQRTGFTSSLLTANDVNTEFYAHGQQAYITAMENAKKNGNWDEAKDEAIDANAFQKDFNDIFARLVWKFAPNNVEETKTGLTRTKNKVIKYTIGRFRNITDKTYNNLVKYAGEYRYLKNHKDGSESGKKQYEEAKTKYEKAKKGFVFSSVVIGAIKTLVPLLRDTDKYDDDEGKFSPGRALTAFAKNTLSSVAATLSPLGAVAGNVLFTLGDAIVEEAFGIDSTNYIYESSFGTQLDAFNDFIYYGGKVGTSLIKGNFNPKYAIKMLDPLASAGLGIKPSTALQYVTSIVNIGNKLTGKEADFDAYEALSNWYDNEFDPLYQYMQQAKLDTPDEAILEEQRAKFNASYNKDNNKSQEDMDSHFIESVKSMLEDMYQSEDEFYEDDVKSILKTAGMFDEDIDQFVRELKAQNYEELVDQEGNPIQFSDLKDAYLTNDFGEGKPPSDDYIFNVLNYVYDDPEEADSTLREWQFLKTKNTESPNSWTSTDRTEYISHFKANDYSYDQAVEDRLRYFSKVYDYTGKLIYDKDSDEYREAENDAKEYVAKCLFAIDYDGKDLDKVQDYYLDGTFNKDEVIDILDKYYYSQRTYKLDPDASEFEDKWQNRTSRQKAEDRSDLYEWNKNYPQYAQPVSDDGDKHIAKYYMWAGNYGTSPEVYEREILLITKDHETSINADIKKYNKNGDPTYYTDDDPRSRRSKIVAHIEGLPMTIPQKEGLWDCASHSYNFSENFTPTFTDTSKK